MEGRNAGQVVPAPTKATGEGPLPGNTSFSSSRSWRIFRASCLTPGVAPAPAQLTRSRGGRENSSPHTVKPLPRRLEEGGGRREEGGSPPTKTKIISSRGPAPTPGRPPPPPLAPLPPPNSGRTLRPHLHARTRPPPPPRAPATTRARPQSRRRRTGAPSFPPCLSPCAAPPPSARARRGSSAPPCLGADHGRRGRSRALLSAAGRGRRHLTAEPAGAEADQSPGRGVRVRGPPTRLFAALGLPRGLSPPPLPATSSVLSILLALLKSTLSRLTRGNEASGIQGSGCGGASRLPARPAPLPRHGLIPIVKAAPRRGGESGVPGLGLQESLLAEALALF